MSRLYNLLDASPEPSLLLHSTTHHVGTIADPSQFRSSRLSGAQLHPTSVVVPPELWVQPVAARLLAEPGDLTDAAVVLAELAASVVVSLHVDVGAHSDRDSPTQPRVWASVTTTASRGGHFAPEGVADESPVCHAFPVRVEPSSPYFSATSLHPLLAGDALVLVAGDASTPSTSERHVALCAAPLFFDVEAVDKQQNTGSEAFDVVRLLASSLSLAFRWVGPAVSAEWLAAGSGINVVGAPHPRRYFAACVTTSRVTDAEPYSLRPAQSANDAAAMWWVERAEQRRAQFTEAVIWVHGGQPVPDAAFEARSLIDAGFYDLHAFAFADGMWVRRDGLPALSGHALVPLAAAPAALASSGWACDLLTVGGILHTPVGPVPQAFAEISFVYRAATEAWEACHTSLELVDRGEHAAPVVIAETPETVHAATVKSQQQRPQPAANEAFAFPQAAAIGVDEMEVLHRRAAYGEGARIMRRILHDADPSRLAELEATNATQSVGSWAFPVPALDALRTRVLTSAADAWSHVVAPTGTGGAGTRDFTLANDRPEMSCAPSRRMEAARAPHVDKQQADAVAAIRRELLAEMQSHGGKTTSLLSPGATGTPAPMLTQHGVFTWTDRATAMGSSSVAQYILAFGGYARDAATGRVSKSTALWLGAVHGHSGTRWQRLDGAFGLIADNATPQSAAKVGPWSAEAASVLRALPSMAHQLHAATRRADMAESLANDVAAPQVLYFLNARRDHIIAAAVQPAHSGADGVVTRALQVPPTPAACWSRSVVTPLNATSTAPGTTILNFSSALPARPKAQHGTVQRHHSGTSAAGTSQHDDPLLAAFQDRLWLEPAVGSAALAVSLRRERRATSPQADASHARIVDGSGAPTAATGRHPSAAALSDAATGDTAHGRSTDATAAAHDSEGAREPWSLFVQRQREQHAQQLRREYSDRMQGLTGPSGIAALPNATVPDPLTRTASTAGLADEYNPNDQRLSRGASVGADAPALDPVRAPPPMPPKLAVDSSELARVPPNDMQAMARFLFGDAAPQLSNLGAQPSRVTTQPPPENLQNFLFGPNSDVLHQGRAHQGQRSESESTIAPGPASVATAAGLPAPLPAPTAPRPTASEAAVSARTLEAATDRDHFVTPVIADQYSAHGPTLALEPVVASSPTRLGLHDPSPGVAEGAIRRQQLPDGAAFAAPSLTIYAKAPLVVESSTVAPDGTQQFTFRTASLHYPTAQ